MKAQYSSQLKLLEGVESAEGHNCEVSGAGFGCPNRGWCWKLRFLGAL